MAIVNPRIKVMETFIASHVIDKIGKENVYLSIEDAIESCHKSLLRDDFANHCDAA